VASALALVRVLAVAWHILPCLVECRPASPLRQGLAHKQYLEAFDKPPILRRQVRLFEAAQLEAYSVQAQQGAQHHRCSGKRPVQLVDTQVVESGV